MPFYAKTLEDNHAKQVDKELRASHAGETGAVWIYRGALFAEFLLKALQFSKAQSKATRFIHEHLETEKRHLAIFETEMPLFRGSFILPVWVVAGFITGFIPRLCGINCFYYTIYRVEQFVDSHYEEQCKRISALAIPPSNVINRFRQCQADEQHHRDEALILVTKRPSLLMKLWGAAVEKGSSIAVAIAKVI